MNRVLVIGGGSIGERHVRCFLTTNRCEVSLCEIDEDIRRRVSTTYHLKKDFASLDAALTESFSAAVVAAPAHLHVRMATQLVSRQIPVLIEKPLDVAADAVSPLLDVLRRRVVLVAVAYVLRNHPALAAMKQSIDTGRFGRPVEVVGVSGQHFPLYRPAYREIYYRDRKTGGGAIQDALTHLLNAAEWLVGPISRLIADADHCVLKGVEVEDTAHILSRHGSVLGSFALNQHQPPMESVLTVICDAGAARCEFHRNRWMSCTNPGEIWRLEESFEVERDDLFVAQANQFLDAVDGDAEPLCNLESGMQTLRANNAALESLETGAWVDVIS